jgi:hypothetical protein
MATLAGLMALCETGELWAATWCAWGEIVTVAGGGTGLLGAVVRGARCVWDGAADGAADVASMVVVGTGWTGMAEISICLVEPERGASCFLKVLYRHLTTIT